MKNLLKNRQKRLLCIFLCAVIAFAAAGCRKNTEDTSSTESKYTKTGNSSVDSSSEEPITSSEESPPGSYYAPTVNSTPASDNTNSSDNTVAEEKDPWVNPAPDKKRTPVTVTEAVEKNGKRYVEYLGKPYLQFGVQVTFDRIQGMTSAMREEFFQKAKELNFKTVIVAVRWNQLEPEEGKYNLYRVSELLRFAEKYGMNLEILWFGDNVCGNTGNAPDYVNNDTKRFPKLDKFFDYSNKELLRAEKAAITQMMNYLYDNDKNRRVTAVQILNEPNFGDVYDTQKAAYLNALDELGMAVKNSSYRVVTRVNLVISGSFLTEESKHQSEILNLKGIDMVGVDLYTSSLEEFRDYATRFTTGDMANNIGHFAEGPGNMYNYPKQVLTAFMFNSGYDVYELKCYGATDSDTGIFRVGNGWESRDGEKRTQYRWTRGEYIAESVTADVVNLNNMINGIREQIASCRNDRFTMIFRQKTNNLCGNKITFKTAEKRTANRIGAMFLAADGYYYFFTPAKEGSFIFENKTINAAASVGSFVNGVWKEASAVKATNGNEIKVKTGNVYRIPADRVQ